MCHTIIFHNHALGMVWYKLTKGIKGQSSLQAYTLS